MLQFEILMGVPEMEHFWNDLVSKKRSGQLNKTEEKLFKKLHKALSFLSSNPKHNSLNSHDIESLSRRYDMKVWQSYLENNTPAAGRIFWVYGPDQKEITVLGIEPHPEDKKKGAYEKVNLSELPGSKTV
jgi:hypothetical protein